MSQQLLDSGKSHHQAGRLSQAQEIYRQILAGDPDNAEALHLLGQALFQSGRPHDGLPLIQKAIERNGNRAIFHYNLGVLLMSLDRHAAAASAFRQATKLHDNFPEAWYNLGNATRAEGNSQGAIQYFQQALALRPNWIDARNNLGIAQMESGQPDLAEAQFRAALAEKPDFPEIQYNLANSLRQQGRSEPAIAAYQRVIELNPRHADAWMYLASLYRSAGQVDDAVAALRKTVELAPDRAIAHYDLGMALLRRGDLAEGWPHYDWRSKVESFSLRPRPYSQPIWDGGDLAGKRILLYPEQGFGDVIQFARYIPMVAKLGGQIILESFNELGRLLANLEGVEKIFPQGIPPPDFDLHCPLLSLPGRFRTTLATIPKSESYLQANPNLIEEWRRRFPEGEKRLKVGLIWRGRPNPEPGRSIAADRLLPLSKISGVWFCSLQTGAPSNLPFPMADWTSDIKDFADTAALMANLDLILTIDTAGAHLAGALGKKTWCMLKFLPDWRWIGRGSDSLWYPTVRLFRQSQDGDWDGVVQQIADELQSLAGARSYNLQ
jgi:tetratricopeptide (TPR) repeat protein